LGTFHDILMNPEIRQHVAKPKQKEPATLATLATLNALSDDKSARRVIEGVKAAYM